MEPESEPRAEAMADLDRFFFVFLFLRARSLALFSFARAARSYVGGQCLEANYSPLGGHGNAWQGLEGIGFVWGVGSQVFVWGRVVFIDIHELLEPFSHGRKPSLPARRNQGAVTRHVE